MNIITDIEDKLTGGPPLSPRSDRRNKDDIDTMDEKHRSPASGKKLEHPATQENMSVEERTLSIMERISRNLDQLEERNQRQEQERLTIEECQHVSKKTDRLCFTFFLISLLSVTLAIVALSPQARAYLAGQ